MTIIIPDSQAKTIKKALEYQEDSIRKVNGSWQFVAEQCEIDLFSEKEVCLLLRSKKFLEETERLVKEGVFNETHFFRSKLKKGRMFWTQKGVDILKDTFIITKDEEKIFSSLFHFIADCIGEIMMLKEVEKRYNIENPKKQKTTSVVRGYLLLGWTDFEKKDKQDFGKYVDVLSAIKDDIENKNIDENDVPKEKKYFIRNNYNLFEEDYKIQW